MMHYVHEIQYIYWAYPITWGISSIIYLFYYLFADWIHGFDRHGTGVSAGESKQ